MFLVCVALEFRNKEVQFQIICSSKHRISVNTTEVDPHPDSLRNCIENPKNKCKLPKAPDTKHGVDVFICARVDIKI